MIRPMMEKDITAVQHIARATWKDTYINMLPESVQQQFLDYTYSTPMVEMMMKKTELLIAETNGIPVGFLCRTRVDYDGDAELTALYILPEYQRQGVGMQLFRMALARLDNAVQLFVYVDDLNDQAKAFYEKMGFTLLDVFDEEFEGVPVETAQYVYTLQKPAICV